MQISNKEASLPSASSGCGHSWHTSSMSPGTDVNPSRGADLTEIPLSQYHEEASWIQMPSRDGEV